MRSRFANIILWLVVLLLVIAFRPSFEPRLAHAAGPVQYKVASISGNGSATDVSQEILNELGKDGWTLIACPAGFTTSCVFKR
jgi:ABC-type proline/glycine betaine transport system substrate-binding protein